jgi:hypothetical protein
MDNPEDCYKTLPEVASKLKSWGLPKHYKHAYLAGRSPSAARARQLLEAGQFESVTAGAGSCRRQENAVQCSGFEQVGEPILRGAMACQGVACTVCLALIKASGCPGFSGFLMK